MAQQYKISRYEGQTRNGNKDMLTKASTLITQGRALTVDASGFVVHATNATSSKIIGYALEGKASSDTSTAPILIDYLDRKSLLRVTVDTGTTTQALVGTTCDFATGGGLDVGTDTHHDVYIVSTVAFAPARVCDATTEILVSLNNSAF